MGRALVQRPFPPCAPAQQSREHPGPRPTLPLAAGRRVQARRALSPLPGDRLLCSSEHLLLWLAGCPTASLTAAQLPAINLPPSCRALIPSTAAFLHRSTHSESPGWALMIKPPLTSPHQLLLPPNSWLPDENGAGRDCTPREMSRCQDSGGPSMLCLDQASLLASCPFLLTAPLSPSRGSREGWGGLGRGGLDDHPISTRHPILLVGASNKTG